MGIRNVFKVEKVQVISSFYPWRAKLERKWQHGRKICSSIVDFFNRLLRFLPISRAIGLCGKRGAFPRTPSTSRGSGVSEGDPVSSEWGFMHATKGSRAGLG